MKLLRSRAYVRLLVVAAVLGVPISALAWGYLALVSKLQHWLFTSLPSDVGFRSVPVWWPFPVLVAGGILTALFDQIPAGNGRAFSGGRPEDWRHISAERASLASSLAALATLAFGAVLGPEAPLIALGGGLAALVISRAKAASAAPRVEDRCRGGG